MRSLLEQDLSPDKVNEMIALIRAGAAPIVVANDYYTLITADLLIKHNRFREYITGDICTMGESERKKLLDDVAKELNEYISHYELVFARYVILAESLKSLKEVIGVSINALQNHGFCWVSENLQ